MINWDKFNEFLGSFDRIFIIEIIDEFISSSKEKLQTLKKNVEEIDFPEVKINAHSLKSLCAYFGDIEATGLAFKLEIMGTKERDDDMIGVYNEFAIAIEKLIIELEIYKKTPTS